MGDLIGLLMLDHFAIRQGTGDVKAVNPVRVESIIHFKAQCHMELEENTVFPMIESTLPEDRSIHEMIKKALSDHIVIRRLGDFIEIDISTMDEFFSIIDRFKEIKISPENLTLTRDTLEDIFIDLMGAEAI